MGRRTTRVLLWLCVLGMMALIFAFSAQPGPQSEAMTEKTVMPLAEALAALGGDNHDEAVLRFYIFFGSILRKAAHLGEYALMGLLLHLLLRSYGKHQRCLPLLIGVAYAVTDEVHQAFVPGRLGTWTDVLIDAAGVAAGIYIVTIAERIRRKKHVHHP